MLEIEDLVVGAGNNVHAGPRIGPHAIARCCWHKPWLAPAHPPATATGEQVLVNILHTTQTVHCREAGLRQVRAFAGQSAKGARVRSHMPAPTVCSRPAIKRCSSCWQSSNSCRWFRSAIYPLLLWAPAPSGCAEKYPASPSRCRPSRGGLGWRTKLRFEAPMRTEDHEPTLSLLAVIRAGTFFTAEVRLS